MSKLFGYAGKMLTVNLAAKRIVKEPLREDLVRNYLGGEGFTARLLWEKVKPGIDPLSPENVLIFAPTALTGSLIPTASRSSIGFKSPLSGFYGTGMMGAKWSPYLKFASYDVLTIEGKAEKPVYIFIEDERVEIRDAGRLWGKTCSETNELLRNEIGNREVKILCIGPGGERLLRNACIMSDYRAFGKGGSGAVMGSKNLKAITIQGSGSISQYDYEGVRDIFLKINKGIEENQFCQMEKQYSSHIFNAAFATTHGFGVRHFQEGWWDKGENFYHDNLKESLFTGEDYSCWGCTIKCGKIMAPKKGPYKAHRTETKAEAAWCWGWKNMIAEPEVVCEIVHLLNEYGVCVNSASEWAGWIQECQEKGILTPEDTGGLSIKFGDGEACIKLLKLTFNREGFGDIMAEGVKRAAEKLGKGSEKYAMHVKGVELEGDGWRGGKASMLSCATAERGASVMRPMAWPVTHYGVIMPDVTGLTKISPHAREEKGFAKWFKPFKEATLGVANSLGACLFVFLLEAITATDLVEAYKYWSGRELDVKEALRVGERIICLSRAFNARESFGRKDDTMPERFLTEPMRGGPMDGNQVESFDAMLDEYYTESGFDLKTGWPTRAKLGELGLKDVADEIY